MSKRRPLLMVAGAAVAGLAAAVIVVPQVIADGSPAGDPSARNAVAAPGAGSGSKADGAATTAPRSANAKTVLLAAAKVAATKPLGEGAYWYSRVRTSYLITDVAVNDPEWDRLHEEYNRKVNDPNVDPDELAALKKKYFAKVEEVRAKQNEVPFTAGLESTNETWRSMRGGKEREVRNQNAKVTFATPEDEAKWKQAGSPRLEEQPETWEGKPTYLPSMGNQSLTWADIRKLPTDKEGLKAKLTSLYEVSEAKAAGRSFARYMFDTGVDLLGGPATPGTRAALYQVLADSASGLKSKTGVVDALGRQGVSLETPGTKKDGERGGAVTRRMIFDADSGRILQVETLEEGVPFPIWRETFEAGGYVDKLGDVS